MADEIKGYASLGEDINKQKEPGSEETGEGLSSEKSSDLDLKMDSVALVKKCEGWEKEWKYSPAKEKWEKQIEENEKYWLGQQSTGPHIDGDRPIVDNLIFESLETFLPLATRRNPEPVVTLDATEKEDDGSEVPEKQKYVAKVKNRLSDLSDKNKMRLKLKKTARFWSLYHLGVAKIGWSLDEDIPIVRIVRPQRLILDPKATIDEDGYTGDRIGEHRKLSASSILSLIGDDENSEAAEAKRVIKEKVGDDESTKLRFIEWWTPEFMVWKMDKTILLKKKNPHWNYDRTETPSPDDLASDGVQVDDYGNPTVQEVEVKGINHFPTPRMPYVFLSVYNLGNQPMDNTSLIQQNLSNQDKINKRDKQIDNNADDMNSGIVISIANSGLSEPQAKNVVKTLRKGGAVAIPAGVPSDAITRFSASSLPADVYNDLSDKRMRLRDIFGVRGSSSAGLETEQTVRGKIIGRTMDADRNGGGITEFLEQFADDVFNWILQLLYVYDTGFQFVSGAIPPKVIVSVKEGSLLPKDSISLANQAMELAGLNRISTLDLYKRMEYPNPEEMAANVWLEQNAPQLLYKDNPLVQEAMGMMQAAVAQKAQEEAGVRQEKFQQEIQKEEMKREPSIPNIQ